MQVGLCSEGEVGALKLHLEESVSQGGTQWGINGMWEHVVCLAWVWAPLDIWHSCHPSGVSRSP